MRKKKPLKAVEGDTPLSKDTLLREHEANTVEAFSIVGIGASAGGLEALTSFLANVPQESKMAFVIVQHLDPTHKGMMVELLQRHTLMRVSQVVDRTKVKSAHVYVIPPNKDISFRHGLLHLHTPVAPRGMRLPIDFFFRSLAEDLQRLSIGVILSGMGSDGTLGLRAIKEHAGAAFVQAPDTAKFNAMPRSAIEAGLADIVAPVEELASKIFDYLRHVPVVSQPGLAILDKSRSSLEKVVSLLRSQTGHDFSQYKKTTMYRRIERRMSLHQIESIGAYVGYLRTNTQEIELLFRELMIGVTRFFRDPAAWKRLQKDVLPKLHIGKSETKTIRAWVPACSTGEEAYTLAILLKESLDRTSPDMNIKIQIFATDLDASAIDKARHGLFPPNIVSDVSEDRLDRFFTKVDTGFMIAKSIREMIIFAQHNIIMDPPFTHLDILTCRNLLIYLTPQLQSQLMQLFHYSLNHNGFLFLGNAETIGTFGKLFTPVAGKAKLYRRTNPGVRMIPTELPGPHQASPDSQTETPKLPVNFQVLAEQLILTSYSPASVLTNSVGDILYLSGRTGRFLEPSSGKANWNILAMAQQELRYDLHNALRKVVETKEPTILADLFVGKSPEQYSVTVKVHPINKPEPMQGLVLFLFGVDHSIKSDAVAKPSKLDKQTKVEKTRVEELERALAQAQHRLQTMQEELQATEEEYKSANEELQSTNEELQSSNEEMSSSKEEMQSMNEEMETINHELQSKVDELSRVNDDMKNLLDSTGIATLFLDKSLIVRRFTSKTSEITKLISPDIGRPVTDIASTLLYPMLAEDVRIVLQTLNAKERQIEEEKEWYTVRIMPYRTVEDKIDGVVITFINITDLKAQEQELRAAEEKLRAAEEKLRGFLPETP